MSPAIRQSHTYPKPSRAAAWLIVHLALAMCALPRTALAQPGPPEAAHRQGVLPDARFHVLFRKLAPNARVFSPFHSWDAAMNLDATVFRKGVHGVAATTIMQTEGTENLGSQISVGATRYFLGFGYVNTSFPVALSVAFRHLSSHLTRDLDRKEEEVTSRGGHVPMVADSMDLNIVYVKAAGTLDRVPFKPRISVIVTPISFRFRGGEAGEVRPLFAETSWPLLVVRNAAVVVETQHEVGSNGFDTYTLGLDLTTGGESRGRLRVFLSVSPGGGFHVSPHVGGVVDGGALGVRLSLPS